MKTAIAKGVIRHVLGALGAGLVSAGVMDAEAWQQVQGAVLTLGALGWSVADKRGVL